MLRIFNVYYKNILRSGFLFGYVTPLKPELNYCIEKGKKINRDD